jgi:hypothetical protein
MMYNNKLVASLKANGKILREFKDTVYLPFGVEYNILLKNLHNTRAVVNVYIDGDNVVPGGLVLESKQEIELERAIRNGNLNEGNRFKFIERTGAVEQHRGIKLEDGLIRIEFQYEVPQPIINVGNIFSRNDVYWKSMPATFNVNGTLRSVNYGEADTIRSMAAASTATYCAMNNIATASCEVHDGAATMDWMANETGITVPGSKSEQKFRTVTVGALEPTVHSIVLKLLGETAANQAVRQPVTVKHKPRCVTCGKQNKATAKFCQECGTSLEIFA